MCILRSVTAASGYRWLSCLVSCWPTDRWFEIQSAFRVLRSGERATTTTEIQFRKTPPPDDATLGPSWLMKQGRGHGRGRWGMINFCTARLSSSQARKLCRRDARSVDTYGDELVIMFGIMWSTRIGSLDGINVAWQVDRICEPNCSRR